MLALVRFSIPLQGKSFILSQGWRIDEARRLRAPFAMPPHPGEQFAITTSSPVKEKFMSSKKQVVRKPSKNIADSRRIRYGSGNAPRVLRQADAATKDPRTIRFGSGNCPATLRK